MNRESKIQRLAGYAESASVFLHAGTNGVTVPTEWLERLVELAKDVDSDAVPAGWITGPFNGGGYQMVDPISGGVLTYDGVTGRVSYDTPESLAVKSQQSPTGKPSEQ